MNLENWLYRRDREEYILYLATVPNLFNSSVNIAHHKSRQEEAEQEIEMELRR